MNLHIDICMIWYRYLFNTQSFRLKSQETEISRLKDRVHSLLERSNAFNSQPGKIIAGSLYISATCIDKSLRVVENAPGSWNGPRQHIDIAPQFGRSSMFTCLSTLHVHCVCVSDVSSERESVGTLHSMNRSEVSEARSRDEVELVEIANRKILALSSQLEEAEATAIKLNEEVGHCDRILAERLCEL